MALDLRPARFLVRAFLCILARICAETGGADAAVNARCPFIMTLLLNLAILAPTHAIKGAMKSVPSEDASPEIERLQIEMLRQMPAERPLSLVGEMSRAVRELAVAGLCQRHPHDTPAQIRCRLADQILGPEPVECVYGPLPGDP
ncbi:MAG: hypothetical protein MUQ10_09975 [Anaerolineae bacterium]|nr:hypothetical protein [Anaerolineae bacterium]